ncbi:MAG: protein arginine kinase [Phycisphaerae bacterium]
MTIDDLTRKMGEWLRGDGPYADVVISSRVRLARNIAGFPFLSKAGEDDRKQIFRLLSDCISELSLGDDAIFVDVDAVQDLDRQLLVERHLISKQHAEGEGTRGVAISGGERRALMINEEDHLRVQVLRSGLQLSALYEEINQLDDAIEKNVEYAFDRRLGFLTACPTNVGTGIRVSVMLHLPAMKLTDQIEQMFRAIKDMKLAVRGLYGEGTDAVGDFFQVSNQITLGRTEEEIVEEFGTQIIPRFVEYEMAARKMLLDERTSLLDDKVWRAYGTLENARALSSDEALFLLSHLRMGVNMGRCDKVDLHTVNEMFIRTQPAHLQKLSGRRLGGEERSVIRAEYLRNALASRN